MRHCLTSPRLARSPRGMTLIELLVVVFIMMIFVAAAVPLLQPNNADRKVREAARQLNSYFAEAKALAAQRGRAVGVAFDRGFAVAEDARDSNLITQLYLVEVPPLYRGDTLDDTACVALQLVTDGMGQPDYTPVGSYTGVTINGKHPYKFELKFKYINPPVRCNCVMVDTIFASYLPGVVPAGGGTRTFIFPFSIRFSGTGFYYPAAAVLTADVQSGRYVLQTTTPPTYYCFANYGTRLYGESPGSWTSKPFELAFPPIRTGDSALTLPTGTMIDLQFAGTGPQGSGYFDATRSDINPLVILFSPGGGVSSVLDREQWGAALGRVHFLLTESKIAIAANSNNANPNYNAGPLANPGSLWVSINANTGLVSTSDNNPPINPSDLNNAVQQARLNATNLNTKGGN